MLGGLSGSSRLLLLGPVLSSLGLAVEAEGEVVSFLLLGGTYSTSEDVLVLLFGEIGVVEAVRVAVLDGVVPIVLPDAVRTETLAVGPGLKLEVAH
jgi:hypothetical protein